ncbi:oligosaccharide flippase family protein [Aequorivita xiaoshiensis]|uniref:Oligosaccharide flippase family protein n=1 Tax=Aequorivita xiaoshiensis TaxID=2874476 RepID=A0A9X1R622_9FLAO|nr:oligosaccharide flippase family protein [Aequorivita xiaoshiensis]MCG2431664.1 oligosaccharide flippase family protein [Aequorivita xiaoshiensis]
MSQLKKGALLSYGTIFLTNVIGIVLTPFIVRGLGDSEYGLYTLIGAFIGTMAVLDLGLNNTIVRYVAKYRAEEDEEGEANFLATTMYIYGVITFILLAIGIGIYFNLENIFGDSLSLVELDKAKVMFMILLFNIAVTIPGNAFEAICNGYEHFVYPKKMRMIRYVIRSAAVVGLLYFKGGAIGLVVIDTLMNLTIIGSNVYYVIKKLKVQFKLSSFNKKLVKEIFTYSFWIFLMGLVYQFQWRTGQFILGVKTDTVTVAIFAIGVLLGTYYATFATTITNLLIPKAMKLVVSNASGLEITEMAIKIGRVLLILLYLLLGGFVVFGKEFVVLWVGETYVNSWVIAVLIMVTLTNSLTLSFMTSILKAKNLYRFKSVIYILFVALGLGLGYFLIDRIQEIGMMLGLCIGVLISQIVLNVYFVRVLDFKIWKFYKDTFLRGSLFLMVFLLLGFYLNTFFQNYNWPSFILKTAMFSIFYLFANYFFVFNNYEKQLTKKALNKVGALKNIIK